MSELADVQHTEPVDDDTEPLSAHQLLLVFKTDQTI